MSQESQYSSYKRGNRETLALVDRNNLYSNGPPSAMKRHSMVPRPSSIPKHSLPPPRAGGMMRSSSGGNMMDLGGSAMRPSESRYSDRRSIAPPMSANRRSSTFNRGLSLGVASTPAGLGGHMPYTAGVSGFLGAPNTLVMAQDPRPLKNKEYQAQIGAMLYEYLDQHGFTSKYALQPNAFRSPTQKNFVDVFKWLYGRIDPAYMWTKPFDQEVFAILKFIRYPFTASISKSMLAAVGGSNAWPHCLGMLHWMQELCQTIDRFTDDTEPGKYDAPCLDMGIDPQNDRDMFSFFAGCYSQWLNGTDDELLGPIADLEAAFNERNKAFLEQAEQLEADKASLMQTIDELNAERGPLNEKIEACKTLDSDIRKFEDFLNKTMKKTNRFIEGNKELHNKLEMLKEEAAKSEDELQKLKTHVNSQGLLPADIDRINAEREKLNKNIQLLVEREREVKRMLAEKEAAASHKLETLERAVDRFNQLGFKIGIITTEDNPKNLDLRLFPNLPIDTPETEKLLKDGVGHQPPQILNRDLSRIRPALMQMKREIAKEIQDAEEDYYKQQDFYDQISEAVREGEEEVSTLRAKKAALDEEYGEFKETTSAEATASNAQIEKLERELSQMRVNMNSGSLAIEQKAQSMKIAYDQLKHQASAVREHFHGEVERMLNEIVKFKIHIQKGLGKLDQFVLMEREELEGRPAYDEDVDMDGQY